MRLLLLLLIGLAAAVPTADVYQVHESRTGRQVAKRGLSLDPEAIIPVRIGLTQSGLEDGYDHVMAVSDPTSPTYGQHLSLAQVNQLFGPSKATVDAVRYWLSQETRREVSQIPCSANGWIALDLPVREFEAIFRTQLYEHQDRMGRTRIGCDAYSIPESLAPHVDYITPCVKSSAPLTKRRSKRSRRSNLASERLRRSDAEDLMRAAATTAQPCNQAITPACIRSLYNIPQSKINDSVNALGVFETGDHYAQSDLDLYFKTFSPNIPQGTHPTFAFIDGATGPVAAGDPFNGGESDVDLDIAFSLIYPQEVILYQTDDPVYGAQYEAESSGFGHGLLNTFLDALDGSYCTYSFDGETGDSSIDPQYPDPAAGGYKGQLQCGVYKPTRVISDSYLEGEQDVPAAYQYRQCNEFMKLALQGHTIVVSSGDFGVGTSPGDGSDSGCLSGNGQKDTIFETGLTVGCPYVLAVGGTQLFPPQTAAGPESVFEFFLADANLNLSSSGGFSNRISAPSYQKTALSNYFSKHDPGYKYYNAGPNGTNLGANGGVYNRAGRGIPDISANGANFQAFVNGTERLLYGTSISAPIVASIFTLINQQRTTAGKGPVGFVNPVLYQNPDIFHDITNGSNPNCGTQGFKAVPGWDPATGLGTIDYPKLLKLFMSLP